MPKKFYQGYCPLGDRCKKRGRMLRWSYVKETVVIAVANHLHTSTYHNKEWAEALQLAQTEEACVEEEESGSELPDDDTWGPWQPGGLARGSTDAEEVVPEARMPGKGMPGKGKSGGSGKGGSGTEPSLPTDPGAPAAASRPQQWDAAFPPPDAAMPLPCFSAAGRPEGRPEGKGGGKGGVVPEADRGPPAAPARQRSRSRSPARIELRATFVQAILDSVERAVQASEHAAQLCRTAAQARRSGCCRRPSPPSAGADSGPPRSPSRRWGFRGV